MAESVDTAIQAAGMSLIASAKLASSSNTFTFSSIPQNYSDLVIVWGGDSDVSGDYAALGAVCNGDTTSGNYQSACRALNLMDTTNAKTSNGAQTTQTAMRLGWVGSDKSGGWLHFPEYSKTTQQKVAFGWGVAQKSSGTLSTATDRQTFAVGSGRWLSTSAITSIRLWPLGFMFEAGATFALFGVPVI
jgi:hypothetical protein